MSTFTARNLDEKVVVGISIKYFSNIKYFNDLSVQIDNNFVFCLTSPFFTIIFCEYGLDLN